MARTINFHNSFTKKLTLKDSDNKEICTVEVAVTTDGSGAPMLHISCDHEEIFENPNAFKLTFDSLLKAAAEEYLEGHYIHPFHLSRAYKQLASVLRHYANLMDLRSEEEKLIAENNDTVE